MGKTHEALLKAEKAYEELGIVRAEPSRLRADYLPRLAGNGSPPLEFYHRLKTNLLSRYPDIRTILFAGTAAGDGVTTTAINFAVAMTGDCNLKVLLVDVNLRTPSLHHVFKLDHPSALKELIQSGADMVSMSMRVGPAELYVLPCGGNHSSPVGLFESKGFAQFLMSSREKFDYVILDSPPVLSFSESRVLCSKADGVVLVLGAGKTRRQVALRAKTDLEAGGAKLLGVVLNRRKFHIPAWLYRRI